MNIRPVAVVVAALASAFCSLVSSSLAFAQAPNEAKFSEAALKKQKELNVKLRKKNPKGAVLMEDGIEGPATKAAQKAAGNAN
ncbi:MAG: hypothetical protein IOD12_14655 [Silvanigrellales bacterium]|nr:hypothetical protein [Silvanigrellales bacterium]